MLNGSRVAGRGNWGDSGMHAAADREDARAEQADLADKGVSRETGGELVWTHAGHSLSSRPVSVLPGPDCAYRFVVSSPMACFPTASLRSMSRVACFQLPPRAASAPA